MAGLYEGLEEVGFKQIEGGGYLFQTTNTWFIGPRRRFIVTEAEKAEIAACIRGTMQRMKLFVLGAAVFIPLILIGAIFWFVTLGATLTVTTLEAGRTTTYTQPIGKHGTSGTVGGVAGSRAAFTISGPPGTDATITVQGMNAAGQPAGNPCVLKFGPAPTTINMNDDKGNLIRKVTLTPRIGPTPNAITLFAVLLTIGVFGIYIALLHSYSVARLQPLLAGLPRTEQRMTFAEGNARVAAKMSNKMITLIAFSALMCVGMNAVHVTGSILAHRPLGSLANIIGVAASILVTVNLAYVLTTRLRQRRNAA